METLEERMLRSIVLREMDLVSSRTSKLGVVSGCRRPGLRRFVLYDHCSPVLECLQIGFQGEVIVDWLHIGGKNLSALGDVE